MARRASRSSESISIADPDKTKAKTVNVDSCLKLLIVRLTIQEKIAVCCTT